METDSERDLTRRAGLARPRRLPWLVILAIGAGIVIGAAAGARHAWLASEPGGMWSNNLFYDLIIGAVVVVLGLIGLVGWARGSRAGRNVLVGLLAFGVGWVAGDAFGPRWQGPRDVAGTVTVQLRAPMEADLTDVATCTTEANGDRIVGVTASGIGMVGVDDLSVQVQGLQADAEDSGLITLLVNGLYGYEGPLAAVQWTVDNAVGSASFTVTSDGARIGGPTGSATVTGTLAWTCGGPAAPSPEPDAPTGGSAPSATPLVLQDAIQGYFDLHGLVEWVTCPGTGPCQPYGHASGACSAALDLRTDGIQTVVPWTDDRQARLHLVPGRETSTLTVTLDDGSPPESVDAATALTEMMVGPWIGYRAVEGEFELAAGTLRVYVEWQCGDQFEEPTTQ